MIREKKLLREINLNLKETNKIIKDPIFKMNPRKVFYEAVLKNQKSILESLTFLMEKKR